MTSKHVLAKAKMLQMLEDAGLPAPDEIEDRTTCVRFLWNDRKVAVVVELDDDDDSDEELDDEPIAPARPLSERGEFLRRWHAGETGWPR
jgi:hypothetical protein